MRLVSIISPECESKVVRFERQITQKFQDAIKEIKEGYIREIRKINEEIYQMNQSMKKQVEPSIEKLIGRTDQLYAKKDFFFSDSIILENNDHVAFLFREIVGFHLQSRVVLLYRGSRDGWDYKDFHSRCDGKGPTVVLFRTKLGRLCGGFTKASWESPEIGEYKFDSQAFVFAVDSQVKYSPKNNSKAIWHSLNSGPNFGGGVLELRREPMNALHGGACIVDG